MQALRMQSALKRAAAPSRGVARMAPALAPLHRPRRVAVRVASAAVSADIAQLTDKILDLEAELQGMFERRPAPKAAQVAEVRDQIATLKSTLTDLLEKGDSSGKVNDEALAKAKLLLMGVVRPLPPQAVGGEGWTTVGDARPGEYNVELALLEAENERLREEAQVLLLRQQLLEELCQQYGVKVKL